MTARSGPRAVRRIEETIYWLNLLIDTTLPICGNAAQRAHGMISADGPKNIVDSVDYIASRVWADEQGRNLAGAVLIQEQRIFAARAVQKADARPGGYVATGGHGGILGASGHDGEPLLHYLPTARHTWRSEVNLSRLPSEVIGVRQEGAGVATVPVAIKAPDGSLAQYRDPQGRDRERRQLLGRRRRAKSRGRGRSDRDDRHGC